MTYSRRHLAMLLPALAAAAPSVGGALPSHCYQFDDLVKKTNDKTGTESRAVFDGVTHDGIRIDLHITRLAPGAEPHPPHRHSHEEMMLVQEGMLDATISGKTTRVGPGSVIYINSQDLHGLRNPGSSPAQYFVLAMHGKETP